MNIKYKYITNLVLSVLESIGWLLLFALSQSFYFIVIFMIKLITSDSYTKHLADILKALDTSNEITVATQIIMELTSYIEVWMLVSFLSVYIVFWVARGNKNINSISKINYYKIPLYITIGNTLNLVITYIISLIPQETVDSLGYDSSVFIQGGFIGTIIGVGICAPICEEIVFRYLIFNSLNRTNKILAIIGSSILFGIAHGNLIQGAYATILGLVFSIFNNKENSLTPSIIMHISINLTSSLLMLTVDDTMEQFIILAITTLIPFIITLIMIISRLGAKNHE